MATELAKAYIQIVPSAQGIKGSIGEALGKEPDEAGKQAGTSIASKIKSAIVVAGIGKTISSAIEEGGKLEQSIGGIETLFKNNADIVKKYAKEAYKTAGVSANNYMEQVTSFSASLISSVKGNTKKAAESANQAIIDMADNANKMGTPLESLQNAYQGFAKQNYTMLDNLKLGYGGTKEEMQRLLKDAQKISGVKYNINNLNDVYNAIHVIQQELGITGTTAKEASTTLLGSLGAMKSSFTDVLGNLALGEDIKPSLQNLITTTSTFVFDNLLPMLGNILLQIPDIVTEAINLFTNGGMDALIGFGKGFADQVPTLLSTALDSIQNFANYLSEQAPVIIQKGFEFLNSLVDGIISGIPLMIQKLPQIITTFANIINDNFPTILRKGGELLLKLVSGILSAIPTLIANIPQIINAIASTLMAFQWLSIGKNIIKGIGSGLKNMVSWVKDVAKTILEGIKSAFSGSNNIGVQLVKGIWSGITSVKDWILSKIKGFGDSILSGLKSFFGIHSPSKVMADEVGKYLPKGMAVGIEASADDVYSAMNEVSKETLDIAGKTLELSPSSSSSNSDLYQLIQIIINLLKLILDKDDETIINLNDREVARALKDMGVVFG